MSSVSTLFDEVGESGEMRQVFVDLFDKHGGRDETRFSCVLVKYPKGGIGEKYIYGEMVVFGDTLFNEHNKVHAITLRQIDLFNCLML